MARIALVGSGVMADRIAKRLDLVSPGCTMIEVDPRGSMAETAGCDVAILAHAGAQIRSASKIIDHGVPVVATSDNIDDVRAILELHDRAAQAGVAVVAGGGMSPGLTGLITRYLADQLAQCDEIHIAIHGTAGPACARQHHRALAGHAVGLHDGEHTVQPSGSGRELCWFPEPVGAYDCYRAELASPMVLHDLFPDADRISARMSATRRDRLTARLPMIRAARREGGVGAVRVEVRGAGAGGERVTLIAGVAELVATCAAATAAAFAGAVLDGKLDSGVVAAGDAALDTVGLLREIERLGVRLQEFTGIPHPAHPPPSSDDATESAAPTNGESR